MWLRCPLLLLSCAIVVAIQGVDACVWEGHKFNVGPLTVPAKQHAPPHSGTPSYWHGSICTPTDAPASLHDCAGRANLYEEDASTKTCLGAFVAVSSEWSTVALPNVGLALANSFIDEAKNSSIVVTLQCGGGERGTRMTNFANNGVLLGARWLGFVTSDLPHKFCEAHIMHNTTTEAPSSRPTHVPTSMPTTTAETTVTARPTTTTAAPPPVTTASPRPTSSSSCRLNGQSFTLPYVAFPYGMNDQVNSSWYNLYWTFSLCEPVPLSSTCYDGRPANVFQSVSNTYIDGGSIGGCVGAFSSGPEDWQQGVGQIQKNFSSMVPTQPGILAVTITCGTSPIVNPSTAYTEWMVTSLMEDEIPVWSVFLTSSNVPGCAAPVPATPNFCAVSNGNTFNLPNTSLTINITNEQGLNEASTWSYNLCSPSTFASQCGGNSNANVSQMPVYLWKRSAAGGCEIAFTQQDEWMQYGNNLISAFFYSVDLRFIANVTLVGSSMYPFFALATSWPAVVVDGGRQTMFNMVFGSNELPTSPGPTDCEFQSQNFLLGFVNATVNIYFDETGITEPQYWIVSPCYAIQNPYCDSWVSQSFATQQAGTSTSPCIAGFAPTNSAVWSQLPSYDGISMVMYSATGQAINISIRCCLNCGTSLEVDPRYEFWTWTPNGIQVHLASNNIPQVACSMPTPPPIPAESCYITSGWNFYPTFLTGTFPSVLYDGSVMQYTWYFSLCAYYQPVGCIETADISILLNGECVAQFNMNSNYVAYGTSISAIYYNSYSGAGNIATSLNVTVGCGGASPLELSTYVGNPIYEASSPEGGYSWNIDMLSNVIPSPICSPSTPVPSSPPGPSTTCSLPGGSEITLPSLNSVLWPLSVENKPAVPKLWTISLCSLMTQSTCSTSPTLSFYIMSMNAEDSNDCQVAFTAQTQQWSWTSYRGNTAMTAVFTNEAGNRLANVTVVNRGTSTLTPFSPDDGAGWPVIKLGDSYMWNLYFNSDSVVESLAAAAVIRTRV